VCDLYSKVRALLDKAPEDRLRSAEPFAVIRDYHFHAVRQQGRKQLFSCWPRVHMNCTAYVVINEFSNDRMTGACGVLGARRALQCDSGLYITISRRSAEVDITVHLVPFRWSKRLSKRSHAAFASFTGFRTLRVSSR